MSTGARRLQTVPELGDLRTIYAEKFDRGMAKKHELARKANLHSDQIENIRPSDTKLVA